jgi:hypothetical protein
MLKNSRIKGLIQYAFYSAIGQSKINFIMILVGGLIFTVIGMSSIYHFVPVTVMGLSILPGHVNGQESDHVTWSRFQLTMPVKRREVILSKYVNFLIYVLIGLGINGLFIMLGRVLHEMYPGYYESALVNSYSSDVIKFLEGFNPSDIRLTVLVLSTGMVLTVCSLYYPISYSKFIDGEVSLIIITMIISFVAIGFIAGFGVELSLTILLFMIAIPIILLIISFKVTVKIYDKIDV